MYVWVPKDGRDKFVDVELSEVWSKRNDVEGPLLIRKVQIPGKMEDAIEILSVS